MPVGSGCGCSPGACRSRWKTRTCNQWPPAWRPDSAALRLGQVICQAIVLVSVWLVEVIVNDPVLTAVTHGVPTVPPGPALVSWTRLFGNAHGVLTVALPAVSTAVPDRDAITRLS